MRKTYIKPVTTTIITETHLPLLDFSLNQNQINNNFNIDGGNGQNINVSNEDIGNYGGGTEIEINDAKGFTCEWYLWDSCDFWD